MDNKIRALEVKRQQHDAKRTRLREHIDALTAQLIAAVGDSSISGVSASTRLEEEDEDYVYGYLSFVQGKLSAYVRTSVEDEYDRAQGVDYEDITWTVHPLADCALPWIEQLPAEPVLNSLVHRIEAELDDRVKGLDGALAAADRLLSAESVVLDAEMAASLEKSGDENLARLWRAAIDATHAETADALTRCSSFLEATCAKILRDRGVALPRDKSMSPLVKACLDTFTWPAEKAAEDDVKKLLGGIQSITQGIGALRTHFGTAHGATSHLPPLDRGYAIFVKQATVAAATFLLDRHQATSLAADDPSPASAG